jgi:ketosteroid isomerase-like protein
MRRLLNAALWACVFVGALSWTSVAQDSLQGDATKIIALENAWSRAVEGKDTKSLDNLLDDTFIYVDVDGKVMAKAEVLKDVKASGVLQMVEQSMVARLHGNTAVVAGVFQIKAMLGGKPFLRHGRFLDIWLFKNGVWVCIASQAVPIAR